MLTSLFGSRSPRRGAAGADFAATLMLESLPPLPPQQQEAAAALPFTRDVIVSEPAGALVRRHLAPPLVATKGPASQIALFDPGRLWAAAVLKALSEASGEPLERFYLRREDTMSTLALVERTLLPRRLREPLQVCHAELRTARPDAGAVPLALMEASHLTVVIVSPMAEPVLDDMLGLVQDATQRTHWRCPNLLFLLPPPMSDHASRVIAAPWQAALNVHTCTDPLTGPSSVWNAVLKTWNRVKHRPQWTPSGTAATAAAAAAAAAVQPAPLPATPRRGPDSRAMSRTLQDLAHVKGVRGAAVVDASTGLVLGQELGPGAGSLDLERAAQALADVLKTHRRVARECSRHPGVEEVLVTQPHDHQVLRTLSAHPELFLFVLLERSSGSLALARQAVARAEKELA